MPRKDDTGIDDLDMFAAAGSNKGGASNKAEIEALTVDATAVNKSAPRVADSTPGKDNTRITELEAAVKKLTEDLQKLQQLNTPASKTAATPGNASAGVVLQKMLNLLSAFGISQTDKAELQGLINQL